MMTNVEILSEEKILTLKSNREQVLKAMTTSNTNEWLKDFFHEENPFTRSKVMMNEFELNVPKNKDDVSKFDFENSVLLFKNLKLTDCQACDERLWISLCFGCFYSYMKTRWNIEKETNLTEHWFVPHGQKRGLYFNGIARLYWYAKSTYDETSEDPFELTKFCFNDIGIVTQMSFRGYSNSKHIRLGFLKAIKSFVEDGGVYNKKILYEILKYVSFLGGAYIIDMMTEKEIYDKCYLKLIELFIQEFPDQKKFKL